MDGTIRIRTAAWFATAIVLSVVCTLMVTQAWSAGAAPGDSDSTFVSTAGCRVTDTRAASAVGPRKAPLAADETFTVAIHGENGDCTGPLAIPADAVAVALNVTATNATTNSNIRIFPADLTDVPLLSNLNVSAGAPPTPNKVDVKLSPDGKIKVYNFRGSVNIFIDIVGYYTNSTLTELAAGLAANTSAIAVLDANQPFAEVATAANLVDLTLNPVSYLDVQVTAPVDGYVTINYSTYIFNTAVGAESVCNVYRSTQLPSSMSATEPGAGLWKTATTQGNAGSVSGTNQFDISADQTTTYSLACEDRDVTNGGVAGRAMTAIFTPAP